MTDFHLIDDKLTWQGSTDESKFPVAVLPTARLTVVMCAGDHVLRGLFVLFRPVTVGSFAADLADPTWHLGLTTHDEGWLGPADAMEFLPSHPSLLGPMHFSAILPDTYKLMPDQTYEFYFIQHPGFEKARKIADEIATGSHAYGEPKRIKVGKGEIKVPEEAASFIPKGADLYNGFVLYRDMPHAECKAVSKQVQRLQAHLGAMRYIIGTSNFPYLPDVGADADNSGGINDGIFDVRTMGAVYRFQKDANGGSAFKVDGNPHGAYVDGSYDPIVDRGKIASLHADAKAKRKAKSPGKKALQVEQDTYKAAQAEADRLDKEAAAEKKDVDVVEGLANAWAYLAGDMVPVSSSTPLVSDGVVDADTAVTIKAWLDNKLRKPGTILVLTTDPRTWNNWLRSDAAMALRAFHELAKTMGFSYGICVNHTFRSALVDIGHAGYGRSARSIHKTGAAIDLAMTKFSEAVEAFPVIYQHEDDGDRVWWRLYGPASQPISTDPEDATTCAAPLVEKLKALADKDAPLPHAFDMLHSIASGLATKAASGAVAFFKEYYRTTVQRWNYDAFHPEGGTPGKEVKAEGEANQRIANHDQKIAELRNEEKALSKRIADPQNHGELKRLSANLKKTQKSIEHASDERAKIGELRSSFLDLTALAHACGLDRIHSFKSGWAEATKSVKAADLRNLAKLLDAAEQSLASHPEMKDFAVVSRKKSSLKTKVASIDKDFVASWAEALKSLQKDAPRSVKVRSPQILVTLSHTDGKKVDASKITDKLRKIGSKQLAGLVCVDGTPPVQSASDWAKYIDDRVKALNEAWKAMQTTPADAKDKRTPKVSSKSPPPPQSVLMLQPIFLKDFKLPAGADVKDAVWFLPGDSVGLPAEGQPIGMEWWHFQLASALVRNKTVINKKSKKPAQVPTRRLWSDLLVEIGYERDVLRHGANSTLHYREGIGYPDADLDDAKAF